MFIPYREELIILGKTIHYFLTMVAGDFKVPEESHSLGPVQGITL